jgi:hypothetical protein
MPVLFSAVSQRRRQEFRLPRARSPRTVAEAPIETVNLETVNSVQARQEEPRGPTADRAGEIRVYNAAGRNRRLAHGRRRIFPAFTKRFLA